MKSLDLKEKNIKINKRSERAEWYLMIGQI